MIRRVKRHFLILLVMLLSLQMSWAAAHVCDDVVGAASYVQPVQSSADEHALDTAKVAVDKTHAADTCCGTGHGCHGLHSLMVGESSQGCLADRAHAMYGPDSQLTDGAPSARHERPKWPAA